MNQLKTQFLNSVKILRRTKKFAKAKRGAILIEAAFVLPVLIALFLGMIELSTAFSAKRRVTLVASTVADLVAQASSVADSDLADIAAVGQTLMSPYPATGLSIQITSVGTDTNNNPIVLWSYDTSLGQAPANGSAFSVPAGLVTSTSSVIAVQVTYLFTPTIGNLLVNKVTLSSSSYYRPRLNGFVSKT